MNPNCHNSTAVSHQRVKFELQEDSLQDSWVELLLHNNGNGSSVSTSASVINDEKNTAGFQAVVQREIASRVLTVTAHLIHRHRGKLIGLLKKIPKALEIKTALGQKLCLMPIIPELWEAEVGGSPEARS